MLLPELLLFGLAVSLAASYDRTVNYWDAFAPGKLLERLNAFTDVDHSKVDKLPEFMQVLAVTQEQAKADEYLDENVDVDADEVNDEVDSLSAETSHGGYSSEEYERNYEQFVKEYFDRAATAANINDNLEPKKETQTGESTNIKDHRCRRLKQKDGKLCEICRRLKNNEVSETCSYSQDDQPEQYTYGRGTQYIRYRTDLPRRKENYQEVEPVAPSSQCFRHQHGNRVCYECKDSNDQKIARCYDVQTIKAKNKTRKGLPRTNAGRDPSSRSRSKARQ